ncbi:MULTISPECIES: hypothetical protein [Tepidanaerobacter]|uniref:hypothetical protein n=1 Tax=Tepidanaerobacter TaxID=499228 RepID=UPI000A4D9593|nr:MULTISPECIES: hypothetical protein [Tepidanaerobacter]
MFIKEVCTITKLTNQKELSLDREKAKQLLLDKLRKGDKNVKTSIEICYRTKLRNNFGSVIIPRIIFPHLYNETYPPILLQAGLNFVVIYIVSSLVSLLIEWIKSRAQSKQ